MKAFLKDKKKCTILLDALVLPVAVVCKLLTDLMLSTHDPCPWTLFGAQCGTCGGTRCVNFFFSGQFLQAFQMNPFVFFCFIYLLVSLVLLNVWVFSRKEWPGKVLRPMYSFPALYVGIGLFVLFIVLRNIPFLRALFTVLGRR